MSGCSKNTYPRPYHIECPPSKFRNWKKHGIPNSVVSCCNLEKYMGCQMCWQATRALQNKEWYGSQNSPAENYKILWEWCYYDGNIAGILQIIMVYKWWMIPSLNGFKNISQYKLDLLYLSLNFGLLIKNLNQI